MTKRSTCRFYRYTIVIASSIFWIAGIAELPLRQRTSQNHERGWEHLCMRSSMVLSPDWLDGWTDLFPEKGVRSRKDSPEVSPESTTGETDHHETKELSVRLFGMLSEDNGKVYCLYDTVRQRWIRLASGETDLVSKIKLCGELEDEHLQDLVTGNLYKIDMDRYSLTVVNGKAATPSP